MPRKAAPGQGSAQAADRIAAASPDALKAIYKAASDLRWHQHRGLLPDNLEAGLRDFMHQLSLRMCPVPVATLDAHVQMLNERFPDTEHFYVLAGAGITWCGRPRDKP